MSFTEAVSTCLRKYAVIGGRASRSEYWFFQLFVALATLAIFILGGIVDVMLDRTSASAVGVGLFGVLLLILLLGAFLPHLCVTVRRLHDTNSTGWFYLLFFIPYLGWLINIVWCCMPGTNGPNRYGPSPFAKLDEVFA